MLSSDHPRLVVVCQSSEDSLRSYMDARTTTTKDIASPIRLEGIELTSRTYYLAFRLTVDGHSYSSISKHAQYFVQYKLGIKRVFS